MGQPWSTRGDRSLADWLNDEKIVSIRRADGEPVDPSDIAPQTPAMWT